MYLDIDVMCKVFMPAFQMGLYVSKICIFRGLVETAKLSSAKFIAHGATGKGNDQIRFELGCYALYPDVTASYRKSTFRIQ